MVSAIALIVFGPHRLPDIARQIGKAISELRRMASEVREEFSADMSLDVDDEPKPTKHAATTPALSEPSVAKPSTDEPSAPESADPKAPAAEITTAELPEVDDVQAPAPATETAEGEDG